MDQIKDIVKDDGKFMTIAKGEEPPYVAIRKSSVVAVRCNDRYGRYMDLILSAGGAGNQYWSCPAQNFKATHPDVDNVVYNASINKLTVSADNIWLCAPVTLPHKSTVTSAIVYGSGTTAGKRWLLQDCSTDGSSNFTMTGSYINIENSSIGSPIIDNSSKCYFLVTLDNLDTGEAINGARITYTL